MSVPTRLRVEEPKPAPPVVGKVVPIQGAPPASSALAVAPKDDLDHWRKLAVQNGERLKIAEEQAKSLREAADDARGRFTKYKNRLDDAQARVTALQIQLTDVSVERDMLRVRVARQDVLKRLIYEFRQSIEEGPIWAIFAELCNDVSAEQAGGESRKP